MIDYIADPANVTIKTDRTHVLELSRAKAMFLFNRLNFAPPENALSLPRGDPMPSARSDDWVGTYSFNPFEDAHPTTSDDKKKTVRDHDDAERPPSKKKEAHAAYRQERREQRKKNRRRVQGRMVSTLLGSGGYPEHGSKSGYDDYFCRCEKCSERRSNDQREVAETRKDARILTEFDGVPAMVSTLLGTGRYPDHGSNRGSRYFFCECPRCVGEVSWTQARRNYLRTQRELVDGRWTSTVPTAPHGKVSGYLEYSCRCEPCTAAHTEDWLRRDPRAAAAEQQAEHVAAESTTS